MNFVQTELASLGKSKGNTKTLLAQKIEIMKTNLEQT